MRACVVMLLVAGIARAQEAAQLEYACTPEDVQDFGLTCDDEEPCQVFLEIAEAEALGSVIFLTGNLHTQTTTMYGLLLVSEDGGKTWTEPAKRFKSGALEHIQFADLQHGWISGVMIEPLPRDPFFLITTDGGKTWLRRAMFDDTHYGAVQQFWFDSAQSGEAILDASQGNVKKFELYASMTGGESWDPREITKVQPKLSRARTRDNPNWRVRVDSAAKVHRIEKRVATTTGEHWELVASLGVIAGVCK